MSRDPVATAIDVAGVVIVGLIARLVQLVVIMLYVLLGAAHAVFALVAPELAWRSYERLCRSVGTYSAERKRVAELSEKMKRAGAAGWRR